MMGEGPISESASLGLIEQYAWVDVSVYMGVSVYRCVSMCVNICVTLHVPMCVCFRVCVSVRGWVCVWVSERERERKWSSHFRQAGRACSYFLWCHETKLGKSGKGLFHLLHFFWLVNVLHQNSRNASWNVVVDISVCPGTGSERLAADSLQRGELGPDLHPAARLRCLPGIWKVMARPHLPFHLLQPNSLTLTSSSC